MTRNFSSKSAITPSLETFIRRLPKVELHLHLEGSVRPETLRELARGKGRLGKETESWIRARTRRKFRYRNFGEFLEAFKLVSTLLESPADYALITTRLCEELAAQNVRYAEITLAAGVILWKKQPVEAVFEAVSNAATECEKRLGVRVNWIFDAIRQFGPEHAREVLEWAARYGSRGVVAFGIGGDEARGPAPLFVRVYREARERGLRLTAHAGEAAGPESVRDAVKLLGAERIGHGLAAACDPAVMDLLQERQIPVEVCLTSNVCTRVVPRLEDHPLPRFLDAGVCVSLNTDDPGMFGTSLSKEFELAARVFGLGRPQLLTLCENAIRAAFLPESEKQRLLKGLESTPLLQRGV